MKTIKITSQKEFDNLPKSFDNFTYIDIYTDETIIIRENILNSIYRLYDSSSAVLYNSSSAQLYKSSSAKLYDSSSAELYNSSSAQLYESSSAELYSSSSAQLYKSSSAKLYDSSSAVLFHSSVARKFSRYSTVKAYENSTVIQQCSSGKNIQRYDNATIKHCELSDISFDTWLDRGYVVADGIYQTYISHEQVNDITIYKTDKSFVARKGDNYAHGDTKDEALLDLQFKLADRSKLKERYGNWKIGDVKAKNDLILAYRIITGACASGTRDFVNNKQIPNKLKISEAIKITSGAYGSEEFKQFFNEGEK